jgi:hypothetical protein
MLAVGPLGEHVALHQLADLTIDRDTTLLVALAKRITSAWASFAPTPQSSATVSAALSCSASARTCTAGGEAVAREAGKGLEPAGRAGDRCRTSPEMARTDTPLRPSAW